jgi:serine/threonine protein kinase
MQFLHSFGLIHGCLKPSNVLFDKYHRIQIADFGQNRFDRRESPATACGIGLEFPALEMRPGEECSAKIDVFSFTLILLEIVACLPALGKVNRSEELRKLPVNACERVEIPGFVSEFVSVLIKSRLPTNPREKPLSDDLSE